MANSYTSIKKLSLVREGSMKGRYPITSSSSAFDFFRKYWIENPSADQECFVVACLDTKNKVQSVVRVAMGTLDGVMVHPRDVFRPAIIEGSCAILVSHNHPSGDVTPSEQDLGITKRLKEVGEMLGIKVLDHIIYGDGSHEVISLVEEGYA